MPPAPRHRYRHRLIALVAFWMVTFSSAVSSPTATADGTPDIGLAASTPSGILYGSAVTVSLVASNPAGPDGFNLSFQDVLPVGVSYVSGSSNPEPTVIPRGDGTTALVWTNVSDLLTGTSVSFSYQYLPSNAVFDVDDTVATAPGAYVHSDPRFVPDFSATGAPVGGSFTGFDNATTTTTLVPFEITKTEPNTEAELLRGVHDHQTTYTIRVDNNLVNPTANFSIVDFLPAGLEFLGCGTVDNSTTGDEYPGSGPINPGNAPALTNPCPIPSSVTTVTTDPDGAGPMPNAVYTRVAWNSASLAAALGSANLAAGASFEFDYVAAIPLRQNVQATLPAPTANLDNNTGALTVDEQQIENYAVATGTYNGRPSPSTDDDTMIVSAEDVSIHKSVDTGTFVQGSTSVWTMLVENSEYALSTGPITVTDTIPDGLDFSSSVPAPDAGFPTAGPAGTLIVQWTLPGFAAPSSSSTITLTTTTRAEYRATGGPVSANDSWTNTVDLATDATVITANDGSTTVLPIVDDSSAGQAAGSLSLLKEVSEPVAGDLTCGNGTGITFDPVVAGDYRPGDRVCWRLSVDFPGQLDTLTPVVQDYLPAGFEFDSWAVGAGDDGIAAASTFSDSDPLLEWDLGPAVDIGGLRFEAVVQTVITDPAAAADGDILSNLMKFRYTNTDGSVFQLRDLADATWAEPQLTLAKGVIEVDNVAVPGAPADNVLVQNGEVVTFQVRVSNSGGVEALSVDVRDTLPPGIGCGQISAISNGGTCDAGNTWISWPAALGLTAPAGGSFTLTYDLTVPTGTAANTTLTNTAGVRTYRGDTNDPGNPTFLYVPSSNIDSTLVPNTGPAIDTSAIRTGAPTITKTQTTSITETGNAAANQATIGETISYTVTTNLPGGTAYYGTTEIVDVLNATRLDLIEGSVAVTLDGSPLPGGFVLATTGNTVRITFPGNASTPYETPTDDPQTIVATFDAVLVDISTNARPGTIANRADLNYRNEVGTLRNLNSSVTAQIVEPNLTLAKTDNDADGIVAAGQTVTYTVTASNPTTPTRVSVAHDVRVVDTVPAELTVLSAPGVPAVDGATIAPSGGTWDATARTITWTTASINPGGTATFSYQVVTSDPLLASGEIVNSATATTSSMAGVNPNERTSPTIVPGYQASATNSVVAPTPSLVKTGTPGSATIGQPVTYTVDFAVPAGVIAYDVTLIDDVPPGIAYESLTSITCAQGAGACSPDITSASVTTNGDVVSFFFGDLTAAAPAARVVTITYVARVADVPAATAGATLTNSATSYFNLTNDIAGNPVSPPNPTSFDEFSNTATDDVLVTEPLLTIDKDVAGQVGDTDTRRAQPGDTLTYTVVVTNASGANRSAAHDITVSDTPDQRLTGYVFTPVAGVINTDADPSDGSLEWTVAGPLAPGASITITYQLTVPASFDSGDESVGGAEVVNTADVPSYFGVDGLTRAANPTRDYREYDNVTPDTVSVELDLASIGDVVWFDLDDDGVIDAGEPRLAGVDVTVTYLGPNGVVGGGDDEVFLVTTDVNGVYLVEDLPGGNYLVTVDALDLPAGLVPSFDLDGGTVSPNGSWTGPLGEAQDRRDVDFGYTGSGSIGDTIWFDQDGDGTQDAGEAGIPGVDVVVTWFGLDGVPGGGDDIVYPTATTDASGNYLVDLLPAGNFSVAVQTGTLPTGYSLVSDPQGPLDNTALVTLTAGEDDLAQDFGYRGSGSIGDTIYLDLDGDGSQDLGEPGLAGVTVTLDHAGPDGIAGNADDSTFTTTTGTNGTYLFDFLPPGAYTVTVTGGLPAAVANTDDPDGGNDSTADLTLANGADDLDQDFGYEGSGLLGDRVWWDLDRDGVQDAGEPGLNGVTVTATGPNGLSFTTVTSGDGDYLFEDLPDGTWTVTVTAGIPAGMTATFDANGGLDSTSTVALVGANLLQDFGVAGNSSIGDRVWLDRDDDGIQDAGEPGIENITVELTWYGPNGVPGGGDDIVLTTETDANGNYLFEGLPAGSYSVQVDEADTDFTAGVTATYDRDGTTVSPNGVTPVTLGASQAITDVDFGYRGGGAIGDLVWFDRDGDGTQDPDEPGLAGIGVTLVWYGEDGTLGTPDDETFTTTTDADGAYIFDGLPAGIFDVTVSTGDLPAGMLPTFDADGGLDDTSQVTLADGGVDLDQDFGYRGAGGVGDTVWLDLDGNGTQDVGEPGIPGQVVTVTWDGPSGPVTFTTTTDADGNYFVGGLPDGDVTVTVVGGIATTATITGDPDGDSNSTSTITIVGGATNLDQDFGYRGVNSLGDFVWYDIDIDGSQDAGEPGLTGVTVTVTWFGADGVAGGGDDMVFTTTTDAAGNYLVTDLPDGTYSVVLGGGLPAGLTIDTYDEDDGTSAPNGATVVDDLGVGDPAPVVHLTADFGVAGTGAIGDTIWLDLDGDGTLDAGEPGIPGVVVTLTWAGPDGDLGTADDVVFPTQETSSDGTYRFDDLPAGPFRVDLANLPAGLSVTADPDGGTRDTATLTLGVGVEDLDQDFGYRGDASIGDTVWLDLDGDGTQDPGEPGMPGITVTVTSPGADGITGTADDLVVVTETDTDGRYLVGGLPGVTTTVSYDPTDLGPGLVPDSDLDGGSLTTVTVDLDPGDDRRDADFGIVGTATISGVVFDDINGDGIQDPGEQGIPGVTVDATWNGPNGPVTLVAVTGPDGGWSFDQVPPGNYVAVINVDTLRTGDVTTTPISVSVVVPVGGTARVIHGATPGATLGDRIWHDRDRDGVQDTNEAGIPGVRVTLLDADGNTVGTRTTDSRGEYLFEDLPPGVYTVVVDPTSLPAGYTQTSDPDGIRDHRNTVELSAGEIDLFRDFGYSGPVTTADVDGDLATTGSTIAPRVMAALLLISVGLVLLAVSRRRPARG